MAILMPLVYPLGHQLPLDAGLSAATSLHIHLAAVSAVLAGAVFGDHCSPFSDTTIVSSISCGVEPHDHVRTQIPFALIAASVAAAAGFIPAGLGFPAWASLLVGVTLLVLLPRVFRRAPPL